MRSQVSAHAWREHYQSKLIEQDQLLEKVAELRSTGKKIATTNGSFDLLHAGHLHFLFEAASVADVLIVLINSDASVQAYKNPSRPIIPLQYRMEMIAALECVDYVTSFDELDPRSVLETIEPDIHVNGEEYGADCVEASIVKHGGGKLHLVQRLEGLSTSDVIERVIEVCG